ncbi:hypothetical protein RJ639_036076 [Escallonia herrerae]|uniref:Ubiquitin thioesterase OTU n=1 Tax=Escallonia herrerae TaxID=1293975 RepID=A0AA88WPK4_9ASTE|nr:hypothetical protein RJ639_036076 [Escallonia herrerae]
MAPPLVDFMARKPCNETILEQLRHGRAKFELVSAPVTSISSHNTQRSPTAFLSENTHLFFARIGSSFGGGSAALKNMERYSVQKVTGDGRCKRHGFQQGYQPSPTRREKECRMAVKEAICDNEQERVPYEEALVAITVEESLKRYCQQIGRADFWGGESELLVLSKLCRQPIIVYIPEHEHTKGGRGSGFIPIAEYGAKYGKGPRKEKSRKVVRLLYSGKNHYDLLV